MEYTIKYPRRSRNPLRSEACFRERAAAENPEKEGFWEIGKICINTCLDAAYKSKQSNVEGLYEVGCVMT